MSTRFYAPCYLPLYMPQWDKFERLVSCGKGIAPNDVVEIGEVAIKEVDGVWQPVLEILGREVPHYVLIREISIVLDEHSKWWRSATAVSVMAGEGVLKHIREDLKKYEKPPFVPTKRNPRPYLLLVVP